MKDNIHIYPSTFEYESRMNRIGDALVKLNIFERIIFVGKWNRGLLKNEKLDLIFLDPPYKEKNIKVILENIAKLKLLKESGLIVLHRHKKTKDNIEEKFIIKRSVKYGISKIMFIKLIK